jgi:hypothetical protein
MYYKTEIKTLPNGVEIPDDDFFIWKEYDFKCIMCRGYAVTLHESPPKSLNPDWKSMPDTRFPLCNQHHAEVHQMNWKVANILLRNLRTTYFPNAEKGLKNVRIGTI